MGGGMTNTKTMGMSTIKSEQKPVWGEYTGFTLLGSRPAGSWVITHVRLNFAHGQQLLDYLWNGERLMGIQFSPYPGYFSFRPTSAMSFASYDPRSGRSVGMGFAAGPGAALTLTLTGGSESHTAVREQ